MLAYRVGSSDEELTATGLSHYLEHLMFKGTEKLVPGDIDRLTQRAGGRNNAYTNEDFTNYHFQFAGDGWTTALEIEADRMRNLRIDEKHEFEQEKGAVIAELDRNEDQPFDLEIKALLPILFGKTDPYGHPVIGEKAQVRGATAEVIKGHYDRWYQPNNAVLVMAGGFDPEKAQAKIRELFGPLHSKTLPDRKTAKLAERSSPQRLEISSKFEVPRMIMGFNGVRMSDVDNATLSVIQALLAGGRTTRLYKKLVDDDAIASDVGAGNYSGRYPGWFGIQVELLKGQSRQKAEDTIVAELKRLATEPVPAAELKRVQRGIIASTVFSREGVQELADSIAHAVMQSDLDELKNELPKIVAVTPEAVQAAAKKYLDPNRRVVVWSVPPGGGGASGSDSGKPPNRRPADSADAGGAFRIESTKRLVLPNGLTLLLLEDHRLPIVVADAYVRGTRTHEPADKSGVASLIGTMLDEGTAKRSGPEIATAIEDVGGQLDVGPAGATVRVLSPDRVLGLDLLIDVLTQPSFPADSLKRKRAQTLSAIDDSERRANVRAQRKFLESIYGADHPLSRPALGLRSIVEKLSRADLQAYHAALFVPNNTVIAIVGDFKTDEVVAELTKLTANWKQRDVPVAKLPPPKSLSAFTQTIIPVPEANQLYVYLGHRGIRRSDPDYYKLLVMDNVLGTGSGFTDRLSANLRDRQGLAYTVNASITGDAGEEPGTFTCFVGTFPDKLAAVKEGCLKEIERLRKEPPTTEEVEGAKKYLLGSLPFRYTTSASVAEQLLRIERFGLGFDFRSKFRDAVGAVKPGDVLAAAQKYLDPAHVVLVAAGPVSSAGKPLAQEK
jgi:zinc protease